MKFDLVDVKRLADTFDRGPTGDAWLDARYEVKAAKLNPSFYWRLFYHLCRQFRPALSVELGAWQGTCAAHMAAAGGVVATIDHHSDPGDDKNEAMCREAAQRYPNLFYYKAWTWDVTWEVSQLGDGIDLLFIDSWHHYDKAMRDWEAYEPLLADEALVVCDDLANVEPTLHMMLEWWDDVSWRFERFVKPGIATYNMGFFRYVRE